MHHLLMETEDNSKPTRKEVTFWNRTVIFFCCLMLLDLAFLSSDTVMDRYQRCFLYAVLGLRVFLHAVSSSQVNDGIIY